MNSVVPRTDRRRGRLVLLCLAALFLAPVGLAFWMYYGHHLVPTHTVNYGDLVQPPRQLPSLGLVTPSGAPVAEGFLRHRWTMVYFAGDHCGVGCRNDLIELKKVRLAMDQERGRVQRVVLGLPPCCTDAELGSADPDLTVAYVDTAAGRALLSAFPPADGALPGSSLVYVVDPLGNLVLRFAPGTDRGGLIKDLAKLLRLSHIG